jgi:hypothetical protein
MGSLPLGNGARPESKERMGAGAHDGSNGAEVNGTSPPQLAEQMTPFKLELTAGGDDRRDRARSAEFVGIKAITAACGLVVNDTEVSVDRRHGRRRPPEALELWMVAIPTGRSGEHCLREQSFAPEGDQAASVQIGRVNGPESHVTSR